MEHMSENLLPLTITILDEYFDVCSLTNLSSLCLPCINFKLLYCTPETNCSPLKREIQTLGQWEQFYFFFLSTIVPGSMSQKYDIFYIFTAVLVGALNDRLLLANPTDVNPRQKKKIEIKSCLVGLLEPLLIGFGTMQQYFAQKLDLPETLYQITSRYMIIEF